jgi:hypothetical protein
VESLSRSQDANMRCDAMMLAGPRCSGVWRARLVRVESLSSDSQDAKMRCDAMLSGGSRCLAQVSGGG